jgi:predicted DCC family thiol-disulfide oxidoreductase YuxK
MASPSAPDLTLLFDGGCPLCVREVRFLQRRDRQGRLAFVDIDATDYDAEAHAGISYPGPPWAAFMPSQAPGRCCVM